MFPLHFPSGLVVPVSFSSYPRTTNPVAYLTVEVWKFGGGVIDTVLIRYSQIKSVMLLNFPADAITVLVYIHPLFRYCNVCRYLH